VLQGLATRHDHPDADSAFSMQPFEVLQVAVEKWVFVVPLDFKGDDAGWKRLNVINFVRN